MSSLNRDYYKQKASASILIGGVLVFAVVFFHYSLKQAPTEKRLEDQQFEIDIKMSVDELFHEGEYYFNHDDDPAGPYDIAKAREYYEAAIRKDPQAHPQVWYQLGRIDFIEGKFNSALYKFAKQLEYFPDAGVNPDYMIGLTYGYKARRTGDEADWQKGEEAFRDFIEAYPEPAWPRVDLAWIYFAQGKYEEMIPVLERGLEYKPFNPWLTNMYALALLNTDQAEEALIYFYATQDLAKELTPEEWGKSYPGNNPTDWEQGLKEFQAAIAKNIALTKNSLELE